MKQTHSHGILRPRLHYAVQKGWMNDPNGLIFDGKDYHLFYQYHPHDIVHGPMHWGHARSRDLMHWADMPIALFPDENGVIFSGSAVMDTGNTSGFGRDNCLPMVAVFTHHNAAGDRVVQSQNIAYSLDGGKTFFKYAGNPVLRTGMRDFRDPKVFWHTESGRWVMAVAGGRNVMLFTSPDLKAWRHTGTFETPNPAPRGIWECPDLQRYETADGVKWVLMVSINSGDDGDFGIQYFVGDFDGETFTAETAASDILKLDFGYDNYAAVTYNGIADRVVCIGWMNCWYYADQIPADGFRGAMTLPRELRLVKTARGYRLFQQPVRELWDALRPCAAFSTDTVAIRVALDGTDSKITLKNSKNSLSITTNARDQSITVDRRGCGHRELGPRFFSPRTGHWPGAACGELLIVADTASIEVFAADGAVAGTVQYFIDEPFSAVETAGGARNLTFYEESK